MRTPILHNHMTMGQLIIILLTVNVMLTLVQITITNYNRIYPSNILEQIGQSSTKNERYNNDTLLAIKNLDDHIIRLSNEGLKELATKH